MDESLKTLAQRVRYARAKAGISQAQLAREIGTKAQTIQSIESGRSRKSRYLIEIAKRCAVRAEWLATGEAPISRSAQHERAAMEDPAPYSHEELDLLHAWNLLPQDRRLFLKEMIFLEAIAARHLPWLRFGRPNGSSYAEFERRAIKAIERIKRSEAKKT